MRSFSVLLAAALLTASAAAAASLNSTDRSYLTGAISANLGAYALATAAEKNGTGSVKSFGKALAQQTQTQSRELDALAKRYGVSVPKSPPIQDSYNYGVLIGMTGSSFDRAFATDLRTDDLMRLSSEQNELRHGADGRIKSLAKQHEASTKRELARLKNIK